MYDWYLVAIFTFFVPMDQLDLEIELDVNWIELNVLSMK